MFCKTLEDLLLKCNQKIEEATLQIENENGGKSWKNMCFYFGYFNGFIACRLGYLLLL